MPVARDKQGSGVALGKQAESGGAFLPEGHDLPETGLRNSEPLPKEGAPQMTSGSSVGPAEWVEAHGDYLFRFALLRVRNKSLAEDLVQDALVSALKAWSQFEGRSSVRTWLTGILLNKIIDHFRASEQRLVAAHDPSELSGSVDKHFTKMGIWNSVLSDWASNPQKHLENKDFLGVLGNCVGKLTLVAQRVFVLKVLDGLSTEEVCNILKVTPSHVWVLVHRARLALRDCIELNWIKAES